ncbi:MAG: hypothetical protein ACRDUT_01255 [Mycobacterium sp.]
MTDRFDVAARLAEGRAAVEHTQTYVRACHVLGYQHPDLTARGSQVCDWYDTEAGLDLRVLDDDAAELWAAVNSIDEALQVQRTQIAQLAAAWAGPAADFAARFLRRHCDAAAAVAVHVRAAAGGCAALRDNLWQMVDGKAATAIAIDDRRVAERSAWLAAAHTVTTGAGDRSVADQLVRQRVNPYVDNDIRTDWLMAMRSTTASVAASYDAVTDALTQVQQACFEVPGDFGPPNQLPLDEPVDDAPAAAPAAFAATPPPATAAVAPDPPPAMPPTPATVPADMLDGLPPAAPLSDLATPFGDASGGMSTGAGSLGGLAGSVGGVVGKIVDGIGGLLGSLADGFGDSLDADDPLTADDALDTDKADDDKTDDGPDDKDAEPTDADDDAASETDGESSPPADDVVDEPAPQQVTVPPMDTPPPGEAAPVAPPPAEPSASEPQPEGSTPCEIAADELPQAGQ